MTRTQTITPFDNAAKVNANLMTVAPLREWLKAHGYDDTPTHLATLANMVRAAAMTAATAYLATDAVTDFATYAAREAEKEAKRQADKDARKAARTEKRAQKAEKARAAKPTPAATVEDLVELVARHQELYNANRALTEAEEAELKSLTERLSASVKPRAAKARAAAPVAPDSGLGYSKAAQTRGKGTKKAQSA